MHDLSELEAPGPFVRAMELALALQPEEEVCVRTPRVPNALLIRLRERGFDFEVSGEPAGTALVRIRRGREG